MKKLLLAIGIIFTVLSFNLQEEANDSPAPYAEREAVMKEKNSSDEIQHRIEIISKDIRSSNCLTPRRHIQSTYYSPHIRVIKHAIRTIQDIRLKGVSQLQRVNEYTSKLQTIKNSTLLSSTGYHVFALRKIII